MLADFLTAVFPVTIKKMLGDEAAKHHKSMSLVSKDAVRYGLCLERGEKPDPLLQGSFSHAAAESLGWDAPSLKDIRAYLTSKGFYCYTEKGIQCMQDAQGGMQIKVGGDPYNVSGWAIQVVVLHYSGRNIAEPSRTVYLSVQDGVCTVDSMARDLQGFREQLQCRRAGRR